MKETLLRIGTIYLPVQNVEVSSQWYVQNLGAKLNYHDEKKAILDFANQSIFLIKAKEGQKANFIDVNNHERFTVTFEVNGLDALKLIHKQFKEKGIQTGEIENRGHAGRNFVFSDLDGVSLMYGVNLVQSSKKNICLHN